MKIGTDGNGLKLAINHGFEEMEKSQVDGFKYPIGEVNGNQVYVVWGDDSKPSREEIEIEPGMTYTAVWEEE
jgi:hypothetical protein